VTEIERLISRYLDGELTPSEETRLRKFLVESPDARALLREMTVLSRAARRTPALHSPASGMEARLFQRLRAEGYSNENRLKEPEMAAMAQQALPHSSMSRFRGAVLIVAMVIAVIGGGYLLNERDVEHGPLEAKVLSPIVLPIVRDRGVRTEIPAITLDSTPRTLSRSTPPAAARWTAARPALAPATVKMRMRETEPAPDLALGTTISPEERSLADSTIPLVSRENEVPALPLRSLASAQAQEDQPAPDVAPLPVGSDERGAMWSTSLRGGIASVGTSGKRASDMILRIGMEMKGGHQMSFLVGSSAILTETRHRNTGIGMSVPAPAQPSGGNRLSSYSGLPEYEEARKNEPWLGVGYNYSVKIAKGITLDPGVKAGIGNTTWRVGLELPVRCRLGSKVSMECAVLASRVLARDAGGNEFTTVNMGNNFIYKASVTQLAFNSVGLQFGIRIDLAGGE
jgi:hypothetical protein